MIVYGIGYQGKTLDVLVDRLRLAGVEMVVDVRLNAWSRKPGFSKSQLERRLAEEGMEYVHAPELGNEKDNRIDHDPRYASHHADAWRAIMAAGPTVVISVLHRPTATRTH